MLTTPQSPYLTALGDLLGGALLALVFITRHSRAGYILVLSERWLRNDL